MEALLQIEAENIHTQLFHIKNVALLFLWQLIVVLVALFILLQTTIWQDSSSNSPTFQALDVVQRHTIAIARQ